MFKSWNRYDYGYYLFCLAVLVISSVIYHSSIISLTAAILGVSAVMMNMKAQKICFVLYLLQCIVYSYIAFNEQFYGEVVRNIIYSIPMYLWSIIQWIKTEEKIKSDQIFTISHRFNSLLIIFVVLGTLGYGYALMLLHSSQPYLNSLSTLVIIVSTFLAAKSIKQQWYYWCLYCIVMFILWSSTGTTQFPLLIQNVLFLVLNIQGVITWEKLSKEKGSTLYY